MTVVKLPDITFSTLSLHCKPLAPHHLEDYCQLYMDERVMRFIAEPFTREFAEQHFQMVRDEAAKTPPNRLCWVIENTQGDFVGVMGFIWDKQLDDAPFIGIVLSAAFIGKGLSHEAFSGLIQYSFQSLGLKTINAFIHPENIAVQRMVNKVGFNVEEAPSKTPFGELFRCRLTTENFITN